jgi:excinuclease UvrABC nuclease subunit
LKGCARTEVSGVYVLIDSDDVVYVGKSFDIESRVAQHARRGRFSFQQAFCLETAANEMDAFEGFLIRMFNPRHNKNCPDWRQDDDLVLRRFGKSRAA